MIEGLKSAAAGMAAFQQRLDATGEDLANANTTGYKRQRLDFRDLLYAQGGMGTEDELLRGAGSRAVWAGRGWQQGALEPTGRNLDVAIVGDGFIQLAGGLLTRNGALSVDASGEIVSNGTRLEPPVRLPAGTASEDVRIGPDGTVSAGDRQVGRIRLVAVRAPDALRAAGDSAFAPTAESGGVIAAAGARLEAGALERSNVEMSDAMVALIEAQRGYGLAAKALSTQDELAQIANQVKR